MCRDRYFVLFCFFVSIGRERLVGLMSCLNAVCVCVDVEFGNYNNRRLIIIRLLYVCLSIRMCDFCVLSILI